jgi:hypothetical protein
VGKNNPEGGEMRIFYSIPKPWDEPDMGYLIPDARYVSCVISLYKSVDYLPPEMVTVKDLLRAGF